jgi:hypothetical protein
MANPTQVGITESERRGYPVICAAGTTTSSITTDKNTDYVLIHHSLGTDGAAANGTVPIRFATETNGTPGFTAGTSNFVLPNGQQTVIGPGVKVLRYDVSVGEPCFSIVPKYMTSGAFQ